MTIQLDLKQRVLINVNPKALPCRVLYMIYDSGRSILLIIDRYFENNPLLENTHFK